MNRAYAILEVKKVNEEAREIEGIASTPTPDRMGDIVEPLGATFKTPMPLLWQHDSRQPIGHVTFAKATKDGISFKATLAKIDEPGGLKTRLDEAWQSVKTGLVRGVSIGFSAVSREIMKDGGYRFTKWEWLELSVVTIPANADATILSLKSIDRTLRAASGHRTESTPDPGASGHRKPRTPGAPAMKTFAQDIADLEEEIAPKKLRMKSIMDEARSESRELNESEAQEFDELEEEVKAATTRLRRLKALDEGSSTAKAVSRTPTGDDAARSRGRDTVPAQAKAQTEPGTGFARLVKCYAHSRGSLRDAMDIAKNWYPHEPGIQAILKSEVAGGTTDDPSWAGNLVEPTLIDDFIGWLQPQTIIGRMPGLRRVPFNIKVPAQTAPASAGWVGEGKPKPVTRASFDTITMRWNKIAAIAALSEDIIRHSKADTYVRDALGEAIILRMDTDFITPTVGPGTEERPASIAYQSQTYVSAGGSADDVRFDVGRMLGYFITNNLPVGSAMFIMRQQQALKLSLMRNDLGQREFPDMTLNGGFLEGVPVLVSQFVPSGVVVAVIANEIYLADEGGVRLDMSREATIEMETEPTSAITDNASPPQPADATGPMVSMFQTNSVALRAERIITWRRRQTASVVYQTGTGWGNAGSPPNAI